MLCNGAGLQGFDRVFSITHVSQVPCVADMRFWGCQARLRDEFSREWEAYPAVEVPGAWAQLEDPATVKMLGGVLQRLSGGKRAKL